eukprot:2554468-Prymnesium_polylepis.1
MSRRAYAATSTARTDRLNIGGCRVNVPCGSRGVSRRIAARTSRPALAGDRSPTVNTHEQALLHNSACDVHSDHENSVQSTRPARLPPHTHAHTSRGHTAAQQR